ncbi:hypothetical protein N9W17_01940 [Jannaschia sp.]|nr:hypothetical protein [Jannaschia sp.]
MHDAGTGGRIEWGPLRASLSRLQSHDHKADLVRVHDAGAQITGEVFDFPGQRRFQFREPRGTKIATWSEN